MNLFELAAQSLCPIVVDEEKPWWGCMLHAVEGQDDESLRLHLEAAARLARGEVE